MGGISLLAAIVRLMLSGSFPQESGEFFLLALVAATGLVSSQVGIALGLVGSIRVPLAEHLVELLLLFLPLLVLIVAHPALFQNRRIVLCGASVVVDTMLLGVGRTRT
jgi:hypothetical protein